MTDNLRSTLEAAVATVEKQAAAPAAPAPSPAAPPPAPAAPAAAPATQLESKPGEYKEAKSDLYDEKQGLSGKKPEGESTDPGNIEQNQGEKAPKEPKDGESAEASLARAPQSWKAGPKAKWATLDPEVRNEVVRREREVTRALAESSQARKFTSEFQKVVEPFAPRFRAANVPPQQAIRSLLYMDHVLSSAPVAERAKFAARMLKDYQVDITALDAALAGEEPDLAAPEAIIERKVRELTAPMAEFVNSQRQQQQRAEQADLERATQTVEQMENDPKYPHFQMVRDDMSDIIEINSRRGVYLTLEQAYTRAVAMNPDAQAADRESAKQAQAGKLNENAQRALGASLSVSGNPSALNPPVNPADLRGTIEAAVRAASGR